MKTTKVVLMLIFFNTLGCNTSQKENDIIEETNLRNLGKYIDTVWNAKNSISFNDMAATDFYRTVNGIKVVTNCDEMEAHINVYKTAFPDLKVTINQSLASQDTICVQWTIMGSNTGVYGETKATGKKINISGSSILYFTNDGKLKGEIVHYNELDLLQQLGYSLIAPIVE